MNRMHRMHRMHRLLLLLPLFGCAPLDRSRMSEPCRLAYDACLTGCSTIPRGIETETISWNDTYQVAVAECTYRCNEQGEACK